MQVGIDTVEIKRIDSLIKNQERFPDSYASDVKFFCLLHSTVASET